MKKGLLLVLLVLAFVPNLLTCHAMIDYGTIGAEVVTETLRGLFGGEDVEEIVNILGKPLKKTEMDHGDFERWTFKLGVEADIVYQNDYPSLFNYVYLSPLCPLKTRRKIGIGSPKPNVLRAYAHEINRNESNNRMIVAGAKRIGVIFMLQNNKVRSIYIAPGAFTEHGERLDR